MVKVECAKCGGKGKIKAFSGIAGGICFACDGKGHSFQKSAPKQSIKFLVSAELKETGERLSVFVVKAKNEREALNKVVATLSQGKAYNPNSAAVTVS